MAPKENPSYYSVVPATVRYSKNLKPNEKLLYGEISALASSKGCCWAENRYFAELYDVHKLTVSNWLSNLERNGFIRTELTYIKGTKQVSKRLIYLNDNPINEKIDTYTSKDLGGINENIKGYKGNHLDPINEITKEELNNTSLNNTSIKERPSKAGALDSEFDTWWELYGKIGNRKPALQKFKTCRKSHSLDQIMSGTKEYLKTVTDKKFQKHGATFLNAEAYMDNYTNNSNYNIGASNEVSSMEEELGLKTEPTREFTQEEIEEFNREELSF